MTAPATNVTIGARPRATREEADAAARRLGPPDAHVARVLDITGARALALDAFLQLSCVEWSSEVATACVECTDRPRLLLNAAFVEQRCTTPERLATLLLHELAHISMGHTRHFPRPTLAHNVAFDAIINREIAGLAADCNADLRGLTALLIESYGPHEAPWFLLRPPPQWPEAPQWSASRGLPSALRKIHRRLYDVVQPTDRHRVQYGEIIEALQQTHVTDPDRTGHGQDDSARLARLLGGHGSTDAEQSALTGGRDAVAADALAAALPRISGRLAGPGGPLECLQIAHGTRRAATERALHQLLVRCFALGEGHQRLRDDERVSRDVRAHRDRRAPARIALARAFGAPRPLLFDTTVIVRRPEPRGATIYLDVSGSMDGVLPALHAALVPLRRLLRPRIFLFSTEVVDAGTADFDAGLLRTTGGTDITPVLQHLLAARTASCASRTAVASTALVLTDGYFDAPPAAVRKAIDARGIRVHLAVAGSGPLHDRASWVASATRLPSN
jgi:hypothetical protein